MWDHLSHARVLKLEKLVSMHIYIYLRRHFQPEIEHLPALHKPNTTPQYVHCESNHPPTTTKNIPAGINKRLSSLSSDKASFDLAAPPYQKALDECGYRYTLHYEPRTTNNRKNRQRNNILWCNSPFSKNVSTNIGHRFLALIDKYFPKDHNLENF